jgi:hypothetical protein
MDIGRAVSYISEDERWLTKLGIGALVMLASTFLIIPAVLLPGYQIAIMQNVMIGKERPLPEWDDLGKLFKDGIMVTIALIVYTMPLWLLLCLGLGTVILPLLGGGNEELMAIFGTVTLASWGLISCLAILLAMALFFMAPAVMIQYARTGELGACFRFGEMMAIIRNNFMDIIVAALVTFVVSLLLQVVTGMLGATGCLIIIAIPLAWIGTVWMMAVAGHLYGQIAAKSKGDRYGAGYAI